MKRVTGLGGIFFKSANPDQLKSWYERHLGLNVDQYGTRFLWHRLGQPNQTASTVWSAFPASTDYFAPSTQPFMINYRVENLKELVAALKSEGVTIVDEIQEYEYGKFAHIIDCDGNKIELWEPVDEPNPTSQAPGTTY